MKKKLDIFKRRASLFWILGVAVLAIVVIIALAISSTVDKISPQEEDGLFGIDFDGRDRHPLTGELVDEAYTELPQVFGVMVENAADAWPLSGVEEAFLVIEAPVEGDIPRFIAFFSEESTVEKIGPVRSARPYYLNWNDGLDAVYAHVGGSPEALELILVEEVLDLNQFWFSQFFWRQTTGGRYAPHNVYTSTTLLTDALSGFDLDDPLYETWSFKDDRPVEEGAKSISIDWSSGSTYDVDWEYRPETNDYYRTQGGAEYVANNVIVIATEMRVIDGQGRKSLVTVGEGDALFAQDGEVFLGTWKKSARDDRIRFYTYEGDEISLNAGKTWIEVVEGLDQVTTVNVMDEQQ